MMVKLCSRSLFLLHSLFSVEEKKVFVVILTFSVMKYNQAVYGTLFEAEHRSTFYIPYWKIPLARWIVPRQRKFQYDLKVINDCLDGLIRNAKETRQVT